MAPFDVPARIFVPSVLVSSTLWAAIFLSLGRVLGRHSHLLFRLLPLYLLPVVIVVIVVIYALWLSYDRVGQYRAAAKRAAAAEIASATGPGTGEVGS